MTFYVYIHLPRPRPRPGTMLYNVVSGVRAFVSPRRHFISVWAILHIHIQRDNFIYDSRRRVVVKLWRDGEGSREYNEHIKNIGQHNRNKLNGERWWILLHTRIEYIEIYAYLHFDHSVGDLFAMYHHSFHLIYRLTNGRSSLIWFYYRIVK